MSVKLYPDYNEYIIRLPNGELNENSCCKLAGYHELICAAAECELTRCGESITNTAGRGYAWALTSFTVNVDRPVKDCRDLSCQTWISPPLPPFSRREISIADTEGSAFIRASLFFVPLDINTHRILRTVPLYDCERFAAGDILIEEAVHRHTDAKEYCRARTRTVNPSDIDALGHMNNCRYGAMVYDAFDKAEREIFSAPFTYIIDFRRQLCEGDAVTVDRSAENGVIYVRGVGESGRVSFSAQVFSK